MERLQPGLQNIRRRLQAEGLGAAIFAETPLAAALAAWAQEIGLRPILVGLRDDSLGGAEAFRREVERLEARLPDDMALLENPPLAKVQLELQRLIREGRLRVLLGSAHEVSAAGQAPGVAVLEVGFPRTSFHPREAAPTYGYTGAQGLCRRVLDQLGHG
jgi:nitrogenase molybdenum-iron protein alpha/beta subunit